MSIERNKNILNSKEIETLKKLYDVKRNLMSCLDMSEFIKGVSEVIDQSKYFSYRSSTSKLTINVNKPAFIMKIIDEKLLKKLVEIDKMDQTKNGMKVLDELSNYLNEDIIKKISEVLTTCLKEKKDTIFKDIPKEIEDFIISNIFSVRFNLQENNVQLFYFY